MELRTWLPHVVHSAKSDSGQQVQFARKTIRTQMAHSHAFPDADFSPPLAECQARALAGPVLCRPSAHPTTKPHHTRPSPTPTALTPTPPFPSSSTTQPP